MPKPIQIYREPWGYEVAGTLTQIKTWLDQVYIKLDPNCETIIDVVTEPGEAQDSIPGERNQDVDTIANQIE